MPQGIADAYGADFERTVVWMLTHDLDFQRRVGSRLGAELFESDAASRIVEESNKYRDQYGAITKTAPIRGLLKEQHAKAKQGTPAKSALNRTLLYLRDVAKLKPDAGYKKFVEEKLGDYITQRATQTALMLGASLHAAGDHGKVLTEMQKAVKHAESIMAPSLGTEYGSSLKDKVERFKKRTAATWRAPFGIKELDADMRGGMEPGKLGIIMGPTGRGKTMGLVHAGATAVLCGLNVVHVTLEISEWDTELRYDAHFTNTPINRLLRDAKLYGREMRSAFTQKVKNPKLFIKGWGPNEASTRDLIAYLHHLSDEKFKPQVVIVDYADLLRSSRKNYNPDNRRFELGDVVRELSQLAHELDCVVWTASQTGRNSFTKPVIQLSDVSECLEKVQIADVVLGLCQHEGERQGDKLRLALLKNRLGPTKSLVVPCEYDSAVQRIWRDNKAVKPLVAGAAPGDDGRKSKTAIGKSGVSNFGRKKKRTQGRKTDAGTREH